MCKQSEFGSQIEQLYLQGMPRKIGKQIEYSLSKRKESIISPKIKTNKNKMSENFDNSGKFNIKNGRSIGEDTIPTTSGERFREGVQTIKDDILAISTQLTRRACMKISFMANNFKSTTAYKIITRTTQPAHVIAVAILLFVLISIWPNMLEGGGDDQSEKKSCLALFAYLGAFATHFGAQIWMTFVSGLSLYFALPRHTFGLCQQILFPKYFAMNSILSICTLIMYIKVIGGRWEFASYMQVVALTLCAVIEVAVRLYLAPPLLRLMREKHKFEINTGSGQEIGYLDQKDLVKCPHYQRIHKAFRRIHMTVAMGNLTTLVCTVLHLHYLASKISVS